MVVQTEQQSSSTTRTQISTTTRRQRGKLVSSRYLSPSPSSSSSSTTTSTTTTTTTTIATSCSSSTTTSSFNKRYPSPLLLSRSTNANPHPTLTPRPSTPSKIRSFSSNSKRSLSVDRKRPVSAPRQVAPETLSKQGSQISAATKMLVTSTRSLSVSFQGEAFSLPISKAKDVVAQNVGRKGTPERRKPTPVRDQRENSRPSAVDNQHRWPARSKDENVRSERSHLSLSRSVDCSGGGGAGGKGAVGSGLVLVKSLQQSMIEDDEETRRLSWYSLGNYVDRRGAEARLANESSFGGDVTMSDSDSVSSGSTSGTQGLDSCIGKGKSWSRGISVSARFWHETNARLRQLQDPGSPFLSSPSSRSTGILSKNVQSKRLSCDGPLASPRTMASSPTRGATRPASPSKLWASSASSPSPSRVMSSPSRGRLMSDHSSRPSILSFSLDLRRGKIVDDRINEAHTLKLLYNRYLQWRFVNARADAALVVQILNSEEKLWNAWMRISELRQSVILKRIRLLLLRQKLKLSSILKGQIVYLEEWSHLDSDHSSSLEGAIEALKASTLRLPIVGKAIADVHNLKDAVGSAVDVMHAMASSICSLSAKVDEMNSLVAEVVNISLKERILLQRCKDFLSALAAIQVKDCSVKTHMIQLHCLPTTRA